MDQSVLPRARNICCDHSSCCCYQAVGIAVPIVAGSIVSASTAENVTTW